MAEHDPAYRCRKTFVVFVTTGSDLSETGTALDRTEVSPACDDATLTHTDAFVKDTCYGFNKDLYDDPDATEKIQNIRTYVVHTTFYGSGSGNATKLTYAAKTVGGGEYLSVDNPAKLKSKIEEAFLSILSTLCIRVNSCNPYYADKGILNANAGIFLSEKGKYRYKMDRLHQAPLV